MVWGGQLVVAREWSGGELIDSRARWHAARHITSGCDWGEADGTCIKHTRGVFFAAHEESEACRKHLLDNVFFPSGHLEHRDEETIPAIGSKTNETDLFRVTDVLQEEAFLALLIKLEFGAQRDERCLLSVLTLELYFDAVLAARKSTISHRHGDTVILALTLTAL
jgi:hypothetical protein